MGSLEQAVYAIIISFVIGVILCPIVIPMLRKLKFGQNVRDDGPQTHLAKQGTPTMGGVAFLAAFVITSLFFLNGNRDGAAIMLMTLCYGLIGFLDDYIKVVKKRSLGLRAYQKLLLQLIVTGRVTRNTRLIFDGEGEIILPDGTVAATGHARYMKQPLSVIGDPNDPDNNDIWELIESPDDPKEIDFPELKK